MGKYTKEDILKKVKEDDVEFIRLQFTDIFGDLKNVAITSSQIEKALDNKIMFDGSSIEGFARIEESDMYLYPDYDTYETFPWRPQQGKVARLICDVYKPDGTPFEGDPRYVLKRALAEAKEMGYTMNVGCLSVSSSSSRQMRTECLQLTHTREQAILISDHWISVRMREEIWFLLLSRWDLRSRHHTMR